LVVANPATNKPFYSGLSSVLRNPAAFCRDIDTSVVRIYYKELQVVTAELPEN
jgi:hypothetical protein